MAVIFHILCANNKDILYKGAYMRTKKVNIWVIISFIIGTLFGTGAIWKYMDARIAQERLELDKEKHSIEMVIKTSELRGEINDIFVEITDLSNDFIKVMENNAKHPSEDNQRKMRNMDSQLGMLKDNFDKLEEQLAQIEGRESRKINLDYIPPAPVMDLGFQ